MPEPSELSRRQPFRRSAASNRSSVTVNSYELQASSDYGAADDEMSNENTINQSFQLNSCTDTVLGDRVTNIYNNFFARVKFRGNAHISVAFTCRFIIADANNPAFFLSDTNVGLDKKVKFTLTRKWFWIYLLLVVTMVCTFLAIGQVVSFLVIRNIEVDWGKREPDPGLQPLVLPVKQIIVVDTADETECCPTHEECVRRLLAMQDYYRKFLKDIPFNFMIGCDRTVYVGRGFNFQGEIFAPPANSSGSLKSLNVTTKRIESAKMMAYEELDGTFVQESKQAERNIFVLAFIGDFSEQPPSSDMLQTFTDFLSKSAGRDMIAEDYTFVTQKQIESFNNSADALTLALSSLPHYREWNFLDSISIRDQWLSNETLESRIVYENLTSIDAVVENIVLQLESYECSDLVTKVVFPKKKPNSIFA